MQSEYKINKNGTDDLASIMATIAQKMDHYSLGKENGQATAYPPLRVHRYEHPTELTSFVQEPAVCLIVQGNRRVFLGDEEYFHDKSHYLITSVDLPVVSQILDASKDKPYLALTLRLEKKQVAEMISKAHILPAQKQTTDRGLTVSKLELPVAQAFLRLTNLLAHPKEIPILASLIHREIVYRLLVGEQGQRLLQVAMAGSSSHQIALAIDWLKENYAKSFKVEDLAALSCMSTSSFLYHFQAVTAMNPSQFQEKLRLNEAKQYCLIIQDNGTTHIKAGTKNSSQFRQEVSRQFVIHSRNLDYWNQ